MNASIESMEEPNVKPRPIERLLTPFNAFAHNSAAGGAILVLCTIIALVWANSPWSETYEALWATPFTIGIGKANLSKPLILWINDGLMAIFFFAVGLEIKREALVGELASIKKASLPIAGALGGMIVPALIYTYLNLGTDSLHGWGIPMATDIAFALGILALVGRGIPLALKVFLAALAIVDDIGAVLVIALFYSESLAANYLFIGLGFLLLLVALNYLGVRNGVPYLILSTALWFCVLKSGVHATIAGVLAAMTIPARIHIDALRFRVRAKPHFALFEEDSALRESFLTSAEQQRAIYKIERLCELAGSPLLRIEAGLHTWVAFVIMPIFALANAGVALHGDVQSAVTHHVSLGVIAGLFFGKQIGVFGTSWLAVKLGLASMPKGVSWLHVYGAACLAGIGFTMSLFITGLAFNDEAHIIPAKLGILCASLLSAIVGFIVLRIAIKRYAAATAAA